uniref:Uncharacterized protein n=1 Tax=Rhizophora mucronata TaxID=61149 RepID=A0A2P2P2A3_RHIMU
MSSHSLEFGEAVKCTQPYSCFYKKAISARFETYL